MKNDIVNHPSHYTDGKIECIAYIEDKQLGFHLGNAIKYITRAGKKDKTKTIEDVRKAKWYIDRYINLVAEQQPKEHPVKTRADVFFEQYPNASKYDDGLPGISPCVMGFKDVDDYYCRYNDGCSECRKKYWLAPVEEDGK